MLSKLRFKASLFEGVLDGGADAVFLGDDHFEGLLSGLSNYMEESETATAEAISQADEEKPVRREPVQKLLSFDEGDGSKAADRAQEDNGTDEAHEDNEVAETPEEPQPLLQRFASNLSELLLADEETRKRAALLLSSLNFNH